MRQPIRVFKERRPINPRFPWGAAFPCCWQMGKDGGGYPTWSGAMRNVENHLRKDCTFDWVKEKR